MKGRTGAECAESSRSMNDNNIDTPETEDLPVLSLVSTNGKTDEDLFDDFIDLLKTGRVELRVGYLANDSGELTHQAILIKVGDIEGSSAPIPLAKKLKPVE